VPLPLLLLLLLLQHCPSILPAPTITTAAFIDPAATEHTGMGATASADDGAPVPGHLRCDGAAAAGSAGAAAGAAGR